MDILKCIVVACRAAIITRTVYETEVGAPSGSARVETSVRISGLVICVTDTITVPRAGGVANVRDVPIAIRLLNGLEVVILGTVGTSCIGLYPWAATPCVQAGPETGTGPVVAEFTG
jgi:hypothetical protein